MKNMSTKMTNFLNMGFRNTVSASSKNVSGFINNDEVATMEIAFIWAIQDLKKSYSVQDFITVTDMLGLVRVWAILNKVKNTRDYITMLLQQLKGVSSREYYKEGNTKVRHHMDDVFSKMITAFCEWVENVQVSAFEEVERYAKRDRREYVRNIMLKNQESTSIFSKFLRGEGGNLKSLLKQAKTITQDTLRNNMIILSQALWTTFGATNIPFPLDLTTVKKNREVYLKSFNTVTN